MIEILENLNYWSVKCIWHNNGIIKGISCTGDKIIIYRNSHYSNDKPYFYYDEENTQMVGWSSMDHLFKNNLQNELEKEYQFGKRKLKLERILNEKS